MSQTSKLSLLSLSLLALAVVLLAGRDQLSGDDSAAAGAAAAPPATAVVELFTSQGCSSCPPADRLLTRLAEDAGYEGRVIPLSFHVDYWNHIGWTDPFSSRRWSDRQRAYARRAPARGRIYTPQVVVDGRGEVVGSHEGAVRASIAAALAREPGARVRLDLGTERQGRLPLRAGAQVVRDAGEGELELWVAVFERALVTRVGAGENAAATLRNDHVVRDLQRVLTVPARGGPPRSAAVTLNLQPAWKRQHLGVAAFLQHPGTLAIHGAVARDLLP